LVSILVVLLLCVTIVSVSLFVFGSEGTITGDVISEEVVSEEKMTVDDIPDDILQYIKEDQMRRFSKVMVIML